MDFAFQETTEEDMSPFALFLLNEKKEVHVIKPFLQSKMLLQENKFIKTVVKA